MAKDSYITAGNNAHKALIADLAQFPEVQTSGFWKALRKLPEAPYFTVWSNH